MTSEASWVFFFILFIVSLFSSLSFTRTGILSALFVDVSLAPKIVGAQLSICRVARHLPTSWTRTTHRARCRPAAPAWPWGPAVAVAVAVAVARGPADRACLCPRSPGRPAEPPAAPDAAAAALARPHPQPAPRGLHQLPEPGQLHSEEQPQPGPHGPLALGRAPRRRRPGAGPRPGQLAAQQQHPPGDQVRGWGWAGLSRRGGGAFPGVPSLPSLGGWGRGNARRGGSGLAWRRGEGRWREGRGAGRAGACESSSPEVRGWPAADEGMSPLCPFLVCAVGMLLAGGAAIIVDES